MPLTAVAVIFLAPLPGRATTSLTAGPFNIIFYNNLEDDGSNTSQQAWTAQQMDDVAACVRYWEGRIVNAAGRQINLHMFWYNWTDSTLGATYCPTYGAAGTSWTYSEHAWRDGVDYDAPWDGWDGYIKMDTDAAGSSWNFGSGSPSAGRIDFRSVIAHEIGHMLGFYDSYNSSTKRWGGTWGTSSDPLAFAGYNGLSWWDQLLRDSLGNMPANNSSGTPDKFNVKDNPVFFVGANASAYNQGSVDIYAPNPYSGGSSLSHLDYSAFPDALMSPYISVGDMQRQPTALEWEMMKDLGWSLAMAADANKDGIVDGQDFTILKARFGTPGGWADGDFNCDGFVDGQDFSVLKTHFGQTAGGAPVPEPGGLALVALGGLATMRRRMPRKAAARSTRKPTLSSRGRRVLPRSRAGTTSAGARSPAGSA